MPGELAKLSWLLPPLTRAELGPFGDFPHLSDAEKAGVWAAHHAGRPGRVPVTLGTNNRVVLLDPRIDADGLTYERLFSDARAMLIAQLRWQYLCRLRYHLFCDSPTALPDCWEVGVDFQNVYDAAALGAPVHYHAYGMPETLPIYAGEDRKRAVFDVDIDHPLEHGLLRHGLGLQEEMVALAARSTFLDRPIRVLPYHHTYTDGPLTVGLNLRGPALLTDLKRDPAYVDALFAFIVAAALCRRRAFEHYWQLPPAEEIWLADDSIALLGPAHYRRFILPHHRTWYDTLDPRRSARRAVHLCGDATRHFATLQRELGVTIFDTGFPVDFAALRRTLGPDVLLFGGVEVPLLTSGTPPQVYDRARSILTSGAIVPGGFVLREANNLPPGVSWANLAALYAASWLTCLPQ